MKNARLFAVCFVGRVLPFPMYVMAAFLTLYVIAVKIVLTMGSWTVR